MNFREENVEGVPIFELEGKIMGDSESLIFGKRLKEIIDSGKKNVILDFSKVKWINSTGIGLLMSCVRELRDRGGDMHFVALPERMAYYFKITKLETVLKIYKNTDEVLDELLSTGIPL